ncbi:MAG: epoxyqueuosine reductase [Parasphingorhabdus sp.]|jgi:epoxyqueuosine reductase
MYPTYETLINSLSANGLNRLAVLDINTLPDALQSTVREITSVESAQRLLVVGNTGSEFWSSISQFDVNHPVDDFSVSCIEYLFRENLSDWNNEILFPGRSVIPLQQIGAACGWGVPSWLGVSIHPEFGTWFAFRAVAITDCPLVIKEFDPIIDACVKCSDKPCVGACPASAPGLPGQFNLDACVDYRVSDASRCTDRCVARLSCPVGNQHSYVEEAMSYFYARSLQTLKHWKSTVS